MEHITKEVHVAAEEVHELYSSKHIPDASANENQGTASKGREDAVPTRTLQLAFGVASKKFFGFMILCRSIKDNPEKIKAMQEMNPLKFIKEVQHFVGKVATLNRFVSRLAEHCLLFFKILKQPKDFRWIEESQ
ncbi:uncharacterized protein [Elaeis guineensis]|uniref:uncharacterized protein n=1 Tax=Elaeis guineensis var. tenera TaxID=51953 RepID=UPI003C6CE244